MMRSSKGHRSPSNTKGNPKRNSDMNSIPNDFCGVHLQPTASESSVDDDSLVASSMASESDDSGSRLHFIPTGLLTPNRLNLTGINLTKDEDRLLMLAKHPNATEDQIRLALYQRQQANLAKERRHRVRLDENENEPGEAQQPRQQVQQNSSSVPVDADTGEAWTRLSQVLNTSMSSQDEQYPGEISLGRAWDDLENPSSKIPAPTRSTIWCWSSRVRSANDVDASESSGSRIPPQDMSASIISDKTPTISNVGTAARVRQMRQKNGSFRCRDHWQQVTHKTCRTWQGRVILLLSVVLVVAIIWTALSAVGIGSKENQSETSMSQAGETTSQPPFFPDFPSVSPASSSSVLPTTIPSTEDSTGAATDLPTLVMTVTPTSPPVLSSTIDATDPPTTVPTIAPLASPTLSPVESFLNSPALTGMGQAIVGSEPGQRFGQSVALSNDGAVVAIGAPLASNGSLTEAGMVQIFQLVNETWKPRGPSIMGRKAGDQFGSDVALSADGSILVVSEPWHRGPFGAQSGNVRTFVHDNTSNTYSLVGSDLPGAAATDYFGISVSLSADGNRLAVGAPYHSDEASNRNLVGKVQVYDFQASDRSWQPITSMTGTTDLDFFGHKVELSDDGLILCVGAPRNVQYGGYVQCYNLEAGETMGEIITNNVEPGRYDDSFGHTLKLDTSAPNGVVRVAIGAPGKNRVVLDSGIVAVFEYDNTKKKWIQVGEPIAADVPAAEDELGFSLDFRGGILVVGSPGCAQVDRYILVDDGDAKLWRRHSSTLTGSADSSFGFSVALRGERLIVGSAESTGENTGMVNAYEPSE